MGDVLLAGFNADCPNWGCRATSLALDALLGERHEVRWRLGRVAVGSTFPAYARRSGLDAERRIARGVAYRLGRAGERIERGLDAVDGDARRSAARILRRARYQPALARLVEAVREADHVVINGEGSLIATLPPRRDCMFFSALCALAAELGTPAHVVNAMLSPSPDVGERGLAQGPKWWAEIAESATTIALRDPLSLRLAARLGLPEDKLHFVPDALFSVAPGGWGGAPPPLSELPPFPDDEGTLRPPFAAAEAPPIALSGASLPPAEGRAEWASYFYRLTAALRERFPDHPLVLVEPCPGDRFLRDVAERQGLPLVPCATNVWAGGRLLAGAAAYISGRYHPSILAALGGTPLVSFGSNSHKMEGLHELLGSGRGELGRIGEAPSELVVERLADALDSGADAHRSAAMQRARELGEEARAFYRGFLDPGRGG